MVIGIRSEFQELNNSLKLKADDPGTKSIFEVAWKSWLVDNKPDVHLFGYDENKKEINKIRKRLGLPEMEIEEADSGERMGGQDLGASTSQSPASSSF